MALTPDDIKKLKSSGYTDSQIDAYSLKKFGVSAAPEKKSFFERVAGDVRGAGSTISSALQGEGEFANESVPQRATTAVKTALVTPFEVATEALPKPVRTGIEKIGEGIGKGITWIADKISDTPAAIEFEKNNPGKKLSDVVYEWTTKHPEAAKALDQTLGTVGNVGDIASTILTADVGAKAPVKVGEKTKGMINSVNDTFNKVTTDLPTKLQDTITPIAKGDKSVFTSGKTTASKLMTEQPDFDRAIAEGLKTQQGVADRFETYVNQADKAVKDYSQPTPLELAGDEASRTLKQISDHLQDVGKKKSEIRDTIKNKPVGTSVSDALTTFNDSIAERTGLKFDKEGNLKKIRGREITISDPSDIKLFKNVYSRLKQLDNKFPTLGRVDDTIDYIQDLLYKRESNLTVPINSKVQGALKSMVRKLNETIQEIGGNEYKAINKRYSTVRQVRDTLNKALGIEGNKGAALMKQLFSPNGTASRKLFENVKKLTGVDLVQEATLAKFAMENIGDVRQATLLEQVLRGGQPSPSGLIKIAADRILGKIQDPVKKARRIIKNTEIDLKNKKI